MTRPTPPPYQVPPQYTPMPPVSAPPPNPRPRIVDHAVWLTLAGMAVNVVGTLYQLIFDRAWVDRTVRELTKDTNPTFAAVDAKVVVIAGVCGVLLTIGLYVLLALMARRGRNWARIALAALAALGAAGFLAGVSTVGPAPDLMWNLADAAFRVAAVVYLFQPEATKFFQPGRRG
ncbi:hypothetical protein L6E12_06635 [Actinokineospora sp. PR83]|uniref:hypothetical protein n=1 Tax=Actinokineospora sp. PR83 TaxID=2884908 RepID=UPI001F3C7CF2|nr:hypothetical protein [Actinokineospora sp. PR83]MCG8915461.1 hypothetical protein [Actinokineospora sp. PR83]